jgi:hypothetical protein
VMRGLSRLYPDHIPAPLSIDEQHRWMLLADFGAPIEWDAPVEVQEEMLRLYGEVQRDAATRVGDLLAIGCLDRRLERLAAQVDPLLEDTATLASQLDAAQIERLRALGPQLQAMCAELASYAVPHSGAWRPPSRQRRTLRRELPILRLDRRLCSAPIFRHDQHLSGQRPQRAGAAA